MTTRNTKTYTVTIVNISADQIVTTTVVRDTPSAAAMTAAKRAAGRGAKYITHGTSSCYVGPQGTAYLV